MSENVATTSPRARAEEVLTSMVQQLVATGAPDDNECNAEALARAVQDTVLPVSGEDDRCLTIACPHGFESPAMRLLVLGTAYTRSARIAAESGTYRGFDRSAMMREMESLRRAAYDVRAEDASAAIVRALRQSWDDVIERGYRHGFHHERISFVETSVAQVAPAVPEIITPKKETESTIPPIMHTTINTKETATAKHAPRRRRLPDERRSMTHKFVIGNHQGYITVGLYDDGTPGEMFVKMAKEGSVISGMMDAFATSVSIGLQYGVPLQVLVNKFVHTRFEPSGPTNNPSIKVAKSIVDYIFRWLAMKFLTAEAQLAVGISAADTSVEAQATMFAPSPEASVATEAEPAPQTVYPPSSGQTDPACTTCGSMTIRHGEGYKCLNCGAVIVS